MDGAEIKVDGQVVFVAEKPNVLSSNSFNLFGVSPIDATKSPTRAIAAHEPDQVPELLKVLGLRQGAGWEAIDAAHRSLVSDLTPGAGANHSKVELANELLAEVNQAFDALRVRLAA